MATELNTIMKLRVPVIVQIGRRRIQVDNALALGPGSILELEKNAEEQLDLLVNNKRVGTGTAVKLGENFGLRISHIGTTADRVKAMGA